MSMNKYSFSFTYLQERQQIKILEQKQLREKVKNAPNI